MSDAPRHEAYGRVVLIALAAEADSGTIHAVRALAGTVRAANESIVRTNSALGIDSALM